jgi:hypothetical protein
MKAAGKLSTLLAVLFILGGTAFAQANDPNLAEKQKAPTVLGGTGLFNTFSTRTLCRGEFSFAVFWNEFQRDPGDLRVRQAPFNFTIGLTNRWELWADWVTYQWVKSENPNLLSGYQYNAVQFFGTPFKILGPPKGGLNGSAAFFPGTGAGVGGILPTPGRFGTPIGFPTSVFSPATGTVSGPPVVGLGLPISTDKPNYAQEFPFFGEVNFIGFDSAGRPVFGFRNESSGTGDFYFGSKYAILNPDTHWFSMAIGGYVKVPISTDEHAMARGRTNGQWEGGPILIFGQESGSHRFRVYENVGYIHVGDVHFHDINVLDLRDKLWLAGGISVGINRHVEFVTEVAGNFFVGNGTPSLQKNNPFDWNIGLRFYFLDGALSFGGAYRRTLTSVGDSTLPVANFAGLKPPFFFVPSFNTVPFTFTDEGTENGFVLYLAMGRRKTCPPPPAPTCVISATPGTVIRGETVRLAVTPTTPGYTPAGVTYAYGWAVKDSQGRSVAVSGSGAGVEVATGSLPCGTYSVTTTVTATVPMVNCPTDCVTSGTTTCACTFTVNEAPCPSVSCSISGGGNEVQAGERVALRATGTGGGNLTYSWSTTGGTLSSTSGSEVSLDTTGASGAITVTVNVATDATHCGEACPGSSCTTTVPVGVKPPPAVYPMVPCGPIFFPFNSARINNEHKACLDDIALRLQQDPRASVVIDGHRDSSERVGISLTRANNARDYLVNEKGVDAARITVRNFGDTCPHESGDPALNRRVEFYILPEGANMAGIDAMKKCASGATPRVITDEQPAVSTEKRPVRRRRPRRKKSAEPVIMMAEPER